jgi:Tol biopolymer transport system component
MEIPSETPIPPAVPTEIPSPTPAPALSNYDLAFVSDLGGSLGNLHPFIVNSNNLSEFQPFDNPTGYARAQWPTFCGNKLAIESYDVNKNQKTWIYFYDENGESYPWGQNNSADSLGVPRCSPNGQYMAYSVQANGWNLHVADINSGQIVYKPDSQSYGKIPGYVSWLGSASFMFEVISPNENYLFVDGFPSNPAIKQMLNLSDKGVHATLSPDGSKAAFSCDQGKLCVLDFENDSVQPLLQTRWDVKVLDWLERVTPVWSADGQWIYFASVDGGDWDIFRVRPDGNDLKNVTVDWSSSNEVMPATR